MSELSEKWGPTITRTAGLVSAPLKKVKDAQVWLTLTMNLLTALDKGASVEDLVKRRLWEDPEDTLGDLMVDMRDQIEGQVIHALKGAWEDLDRLAKKLPR